MTARRFPRTIWLGLLIVVAAPFLYGLFLIRFPITRDVPWVPLTMFAVGLWLLVHGLRHAWREPGIYRGKVAAPIALGLGVVISGLFCVGFFVGMREIPASAGAPHAGQQAPDFTLPDQDGKPVTLAEILAPRPGEEDKPGGAVLVFYRGHW
ncbi:MAG TPA: hypothetical protein VJV75_11155 [Candidatus Polarisedimenticolia bacterium]|nr:hypothetical protein [Candidatus Polarisedimenticolia bacterium]